MCDSYVGADREIDIEPLNVAEGEDSDEDDEDEDSDENMSEAD